MPGLGESKDCNSDDANPLECNHVVFGKTPLTLRQSAWAPWAELPALLYLSTKIQGIAVKVPPSRTYAEVSAVCRSLLALAECINALGKARKKGLVFVPFRNSKLTRLLKDGLCGK